jgi:hypothetical protein
MLKQKYLWWILILSVALLFAFVPFFYRDKSEAGVKPAPKKVFLIEFDSGKGGPRISF